MFESILIANRGEIACRIIRTAKAMGLRTVAIYSSADKDSLFVQCADSAFCIGDAPAKDSYLNIPAIIKAALASKVDAIHPGYGFLSENPDFAAACAKAKLTFIGPSIKAMQAMASKQEAKQLLEKKSIPLIPGYHGDSQKEADLAAEAARIGFPVLIKAANGGGGKGMRSVAEASEFAEALKAAKRESQASFGDDKVIIEKLLINPRHIEVQVMADTKGQVVHLMERDCSIQRRHQKIIEEAPAPKVSASLRKKLGETACAVARSIEYTGAGTVEFLVDDKDHFYFMEMNTRLQVEHPVTEMITGLDLVEWQIRIAEGEPLPLKQEDIPLLGHALECRIYAEDPYHGFIPSIGTVDFLQEPHGSGVRVDSGITLDSPVTPYYDPMLAKLITFGENRAEALLRMQQALRNYHIGGIKTNLPFLSAVCAHPRFVKADFGTYFLSQEIINLPAETNAVIPWLAASYDYLLAYEKAASDPLLAATFGWQSFQQSTWTLQYAEQGEPIRLQIRPLDKSSCIIEYQNEVCKVHLTLQAGQLQMEKEGRQYRAFVVAKKDELVFYTEEGQFSLIDYQQGQAGTLHKTEGQLTAPMPATVVALLKSVGDKVLTGDKLLVLEAMKMEHTICAPYDGLIADIFYKVGDQVREGVELVALGALDE